MYSLRRVAKGFFSLVFGPKYLRRRAVHELARVVANLLGGHYVGDDYKLWLSEEGFVSKFKELSPHNYFSMERKFVLKEFAKSVYDLSGCIAECGSYVGVAAWFISNELPETDFFLFDSFEGLSAPCEKDRVRPGVQQWKIGDLQATQDSLQKNLSGFGKYHVMKGWIPERFHELEDRQFKLVHIDVDLYEPTLHSLEFFYERMVPGGVIIMDDYGFENCPGAYRAANEFMQNKPERIVHLTTGQGVIICR